MNIISPIDKRDEARPLLEAGAAELYGGYVPQQWRERFSLVTSINQRTFAAAQLDSFDDLKAITETVHDFGGRFSLTLNAPFYSDAQLPTLLDYIDETVAAGIDGLILADLGLLRTIRGRHPGLELHASTLAHLANSEAVAVYADAGIDRVVFPRHLPVEEMAAIVAAHTALVFDAFLLVGNCPNTEGLCTFHHSSPDRIWPCEIPYHIEPIAAGSATGLQPVIARQASWSKTDRRHGCGLCAIPDLLGAGLSGLKLVGRGAPPAMKIRNVLLAREFLDLAGSAPAADYQRLARAAHRLRFGQDCNPNVCYYPEYFREDDC